MAFPQIGLQAVFEDAQFQKGAQTFMSGIDQMVKGSQQMETAAKGLSGTTDALSTDLEETGDSAVEQVSKLVIMKEALEDIKKLAGEGLELAKLGAMSERVEERFEAFGNEVGDAGELLEAFQRGAGGTVDKMGAMNSASRLLQMGLVTDADSMELVVEMATRLGDQTQDATSRVSDFALMLANQSIPRLDNFGISSGKVRARILELMEADKSLSREQAFLTATMEQGSISLGILGERIDDNASKFEKAEAKMKDARVELGQKLAPAFATVMEFVAGMSTEMLGLVTVLGTAIPLILKFGGGVSGLTNLIGKLSPAMIGLGVAVVGLKVAYDHLNDTMDEMKGQFERAKDASDGWEGAVTKQVEGGAELEDVLAGLAEKTNDATDAWNKNVVTGTALGGIFGSHVKILDIYADVQDKVNDSVIANVDSYNEYLIAIDGYNASLIDSKAKVEHLTEAEYNHRAAIDNMVPSVEGMAHAWQSYSDAQENLTEIQEEATGATEDYIDELDQLDSEAGGVGQSLEELFGPMEDVLLGTEDLGYATEEAAEKTFGLKDATDALFPSIEAAASAIVDEKEAADATAAKLAELEALQAANKKAADDHAAALLTLAERLSGIDAQGLAREAINQLHQSWQEGLITFEEYEPAVREIQDAYELVTPEGRALTEGLDALRQAVEDGIISTDDYTEALGALRQDAQDGKVDMAELLEEFAGVPLTVDPATGSIELYGKASEGSVGPVDELTQSMIEDTAAMEDVALTASGLPAKIRAAGPEMKTAGETWMGNFVDAVMSALNTLVANFMAKIAEMKAAAAGVSGGPTGGKAGSGGSRGDAGGGTVPPGGTQSAWYKIGTQMMDDMADSIGAGGDKVVTAIMSIADRVEDELSERELGAAFMDLENLLEMGDDFGKIARDFIGRWEDELIDPAQTRVEEITDELEIVRAAMQRAWDAGDIASYTQYQDYQNRLLIEQRQLTEDVEAAQARILAIEQQRADLEFLQSQLDLLDMIAEYQLDPEAILGGLELGLDANLEDLLAALSTAMAEIIAQAEGELGIASPSKEFQRIGEQAMAGMATGIERMMSLPVASSAIASQQMIDNSRSVTIQAGGNTIANGMDQAAFESGIRRIVNDALRG